jgi:CHAP domain
MSQLTDLAIQIEQGQIGQTEKPLGSNWGHPVQDYLASVGINFAASWCMAFQYWSFEQAAHQLQIANPLIKTGGVLHAWETADLSNKVSDNPQPGDIFIMDLGNGLGHTGLVIAVSAGHTLITIEGNGNDTGSREGVEVVKKTRYNQRPIIGYLRY